MGCKPHQGAGYFEVSDEKNQKFYSENMVSHPTKAGLKSLKCLMQQLKKKLREFGL